MTDITDLGYLQIDMFKVDYFCSNHDYTSKIKCATQHVKIMKKSMSNLIGRMFQWSGNSHKKVNKEALSRVNFKLNKIVWCLLIWVLTTEACQRKFCRNWVEVYCRRRLATKQRWTLVVLSTRIKFEKAWFSFHKNFKINSNLMI